MANKDLMRKRESFPSIFSDFFRPWESLFDFNSRSPLNSSNLRPLSMPAANVAENRDSYEISLAIPGVKKEDINIDVEGNMLSVSVEKNEEKEEKDDNYSRREFNYSSFSRSFSLPVGVNKDKIDASYENGLLKLVLAKTEEAKKTASKHISIK